MFQFLVKCLPLEFDNDASFLLSLPVRSRTMPGRSGPMAVTSRCDLSGVRRGAGPMSARVKSSSVLPSTLAKASCAGMSEPPRIAERMHVQMSDVEATHGMRAYIGIKAKLTRVDGTQIFHSAGRSS